MDHDSTHRANYDRTHLVPCISVTIEAHSSKSMSLINFLKKSIMAVNDATISTQKHLSDGKSISMVCNFKPMLYIIQEALQLWSLRPK